MAAAFGKSCKKSGGIRSCRKAALPEPCTAGSELWECGRGKTQHGFANARVLILNPREGTAGWAAQMAKTLRAQ